MMQQQPIDAALKRFLDEQAAPAGKPRVMSDDIRTKMTRAVMLRALEMRDTIAGLPNAVQMEEVVIAPGLIARLYRPAQAATPLPVMLYLHGGGWVAGSTATADPFCRLLSEAAAIVIVSLEYRLAPEHRYPAPVEDALTAMHWVQAHAAQWNGNPALLALGGDSAGANVAAVACNRLCTGQADTLRAQLLLYPVTAHPADDYLSYTENASGYGLEADSMRWFWEQYAPDGSSDDPDIAPIRLHHVPHLPPTLVATAGYDVLRDEGIAYAKKLSTAGVNVTHLHAPDMHHNFPASPATVGRFPQCQATLADIANWLQAKFGG